MRQGCEVAWGRIEYNPCHLVRGRKKMDHRDRNAYDRTGGSLWIQGEDLGNLAGRVDEMTFLPKAFASVGLTCYIRLLAHHGRFPSRLMTVEMYVQHNQHYRIPHPYRRNLHRHSHQYLPSQHVETPLPQHVSSPPSVPCHSSAAQELS
jgi:hypothetical protein